MSAADFILHRRQLFMLPTRHGLLFALVLMVMLLAAVNYNNGLAYAFTFMLGSIACVSMLHTHRNLSGLQVSIGAAQAVFAGETALFPVTCHNASTRPRSAIWLLAGDHEQEIQVPAGVTARAALPVATTGRGHVDAPVFRLSSAYPLGLLYTWSGALRGSAKGIVYPRPAPQQPLPAPASDRRRDADGTLPDGDDFVGLRDYRHGDPPKHVHWKASAHGQDLLTKLFGGQTHSRIWLDWDVTTGNVEQRLAQLCRWVIDADEAGVSYGLKLPGCRLEPSRGPAHRHRSLTALALWRPEDVPAA